MAKCSVQGNFHLRMRHFQLAILCFVCVVQSHGQAVTNNFGQIDVEITKEKKSIYTNVVIKSAFPGGDSSWVQSLENKLDQSISVNKRAKDGRYLVSVHFVVAKDSTLSEIRCLNDPGFGMGSEVIRVLKKSRWGHGPSPVRPYRRTAI